MFLDEVFQESAKHYQPTIAKCNLTSINSFDWLDQSSYVFNDIVKCPTLPDDILKYLTSLSLEQSFQFLLGFHSINFQYWTPKNNAENPSHGFVPYIHNNNSGFYACLFSYKELFEKLILENRFRFITQADLFQYMNNIPHSLHRLHTLRTVWEPSTLNEAFKITFNDFSSGSVNLSTALKLRQLMPSVFEDPLFRKDILFLWDFMEMFQHITKTNISIELPPISDHQVAKVLHMYDIIQYSDELNLRIKNEEIFPYPSSEEQSIRSATFIASFKICSQLNISSLQLYKVLWYMRTSKTHPFFLAQNNFY